MGSEVYEGGVSQMRVSPWLASEDLVGLGDVPARIDRIHCHTDVAMQGGRTEKRLFAMTFVGKDKALVLNATNRKTLANAYGAVTKAWSGKPVLLYVQTGVRKPGGKAGETCNGIRIKIPVGVDGTTGEVAEKSAPAPAAPAADPAVSQASVAAECITEAEYEGLLAESGVPKATATEMRRVAGNRTNRDLIQTQVKRLLDMIGKRKAAATATADSPLG